MKLPSVTRILQPYSDFSKIPAAVLAAIGLEALLTETAASRKNVWILGAAVAALGAGFIIAYLTRDAG